jgi:formate dehydrogenase subunit gamma
MYLPLRFLVAALALVLVLAFTPLASAQQQTSKNWADPTASSVSEQQLLQKFNEVKGRGTIPDVKSYLIEHPAGRAWRAFHEVTLRWIGAAVILGALLALVGFYLWRGMVRIDSGRSGVKIVRFNGFERFVHWMTATCFIVLAITGLNITFGKPLLCPSWVRKHSQHGRNGRSTRTISSPSPSRLAWR